jgi:glutathione S-transferase
MMKLMSNPLSPYGRKVKLTMGLKGLTDRIEIVATDTNPGDNVALNTANPLGKIPCLVIDGGTAIFDSNVICEYLDSLAPTPLLFPKGGSERFKTLVLASLADGILDAALLLVYEKRFRPEEKWHAPWQQRQLRAREGPAGLGRQPRLRPPDAGCRARLSRLPPRGQMARRPPAAGGLARPLRQDRPGLRGDKADGLTPRLARPAMGCSHGATAPPSPLRGGVGGGGTIPKAEICGCPPTIEQSARVVTPPLTPPRQGEGDRLAFEPKAGAQYDRGIPS